MRTLKLAKLKGKPEIFHTLQGEGASVGMPAIFVRSSLCNLHCHWCDTDYTWNWKGTPWKHENDSLVGYEKFEKDQCIVELDVDSVAAEILLYNCSRLIITGGEPLLQQQAWLELIKLLKKANPAFIFEVETNGSIVPEVSFAKHIDQFNISPKLANSGNSAKLRQNKDAMAAFRAHKNSWFKFVLVEETDLVEIKTLMQNYSIPEDRVILMAEGRTRSALNKRRLWVAEACKTLGCRFGDRLHVRIWGAKRGI